MKKPLTKQIRLLLLLLLGFIALCLYLHRQNTDIQTTRLEVSSADLPQSFEGFTIVQISDFHSGHFGPEPEDILEKVRALAPDLIAVTGDLLDSRSPDPEVSLELMAGCTDIAPVYFVSGNHEARLPELYAQTLAELEALGVTVLNNQRVKLEQTDSAITLIGLSDPAFFDDHTAFENTLYALAENSGDFTLLLSHRPEQFSLYQEADIDLTLSGHAHGGQIRIPFLGGVIAPNQGLFPELTEGLYEEQGSALIVSRGLGNSLFPFRVNNRPELVCVTLHSTK